MHGSWAAWTSHTRALARAPEMFLTHHPHTRDTHTTNTPSFESPFYHSKAFIHHSASRPSPHCPPLWCWHRATRAPQHTSQWRRHTHVRTSWHSSAVVYQVGDFRWRPPRDALPFDKGWMKATEWPDSCPNLLRSPSPLCRTCSTRSNPPIEPNSEDCLKLNVFAPDGSTAE